MCNARENANVKAKLERAKSLKAEAAEAADSEALAKAVDDLGRGVVPSGMATMSVRSGSAPGSWAKAYRSHASRLGIKELTPSGSITTPAASDGSTRSRTV